MVGKLGTWWEGIEKRISQPGLIVPPVSGRATESGKRRGRGTGRPGPDGLTDSQLQLDELPRQAQYLGVPRSVQGPSIQRFFSNPVHSTGYRLTINPNHK